MFSANIFSWNFVCSRNFHIPLRVYCAVASPVPFNAVVRFRFSVLWLISHMLVFCLYSCWCVYCFLLLYYSWLRVSYVLSREYQFSIVVSYIQRLSDETRMLMYTKWMIKIYFDSHLHSWRSNKWISCSLYLSTSLSLYCSISTPCTHFALCNYGISKYVQYNFAHGIWNEVLVKFSCSLYLTFAPPLSLSLSLSFPFSAHPSHPPILSSISYLQLLKISFEFISYIVSFPFVWFPSFIHLPQNCTKEHA